MEKVERLNLAVIGLSEGNGHPFSWSAIFNGYDPKEMNASPFPVIPQYLSKQKYPEDFLGSYGHISYVWTQDSQLSAQIAKSSKIPFIATNPEELIGKVDAVLLARDDAENHLKMAAPFIEAGLPIFIDKPFALTVEDAQKMLSLQKFETQIFTCSSLRYAQELTLNNTDREYIGELTNINAFCPKYWNTYGVHLIEPIISNVPQRGILRETNKSITHLGYSVSISWEHLKAELNMTLSNPSKIEIHYIGTKGKVVKTFCDSFNSFKEALKTFIKQINSKEILIPRSETLEIVTIIENGK